MVRPHVLSTASTTPPVVSPLSAVGVVRGVLLALTGVLLVVILVRWMGAAPDAPKAMLPERPAPLLPAQPRVTHQPTIIQAAPETSPRQDPHPPQPVPTDHSDGFVGDRELTRVPTSDALLLPAPDRGSMP